MEQVEQVEQVEQDSLEQSETCRMSMSYGFWGVSNPQIGPDNPRQGSGSIKQGKIYGQQSDFSQ